VVKALRYKSEGPGIDSWCRRGFFSVASASFTCPGIDSASKNEYQVNPGGNGGRCVRPTTYHLHVSMSRNLGACGPVQACNGIALPLPLVVGIGMCFPALYFPFIVTVFSFSLC
jgi:hypothetical protein